MSHITFILLVAPYIIALCWLVHVLPKLLTPTVVLNVALLSFLQASLIMHGTTATTRAGLLYLFVLCLIFFVMVLASHFFCGTDIFKLMRAFFRAEVKEQQDIKKDTQEQNDERRREI